MKYLKKFEAYNSGYKVINVNDNFDDPDATDFDVEIESYGDSRTIPVNYQPFLEYIQKKSPALADYIKNHELDNFADIFADLETLGFDYKQYLQMWVDDNVTEEMMLQMDEDEPDMGEDFDDFNESLLPDVLQVGASFLSVITLVAIPFIPVALADRKKEKEKKLADLARKDRKLNLIIQRIARNQDTKNLLLKYKSDLESNTLSRDEKSEIKTQMTKILKSSLSTFEVDYLDDVINRLS